MRSLREFPIVVMVLLCLAGLSPAAVWYCSTVV